MRSAVSCAVELFLALLTARTFPVVRQIGKRDAVMLGGIVHIAADRADKFAACLLCGEIDLCKHRRNRIVKIHDALGFQILIALRGMRAAADGRIAADKFAHTVERFARCRKIIINNRKLVCGRALSALQFFRH